MKIGEEPFIVISSPRCGSWYLVEALNEHPNVACNGEILNPDDVTWPADRVLPMSDAALIRHSYIDYPLRSGKMPAKRDEANITRVGVKVVQLGPHRPEPISFLSSVAQLPGLRVIMLRRINMLEALRSLVQAQLTGEWIRYYDEPGPPAMAPVRIRPEFASMWFAEVSKFYAAMDQIFFAHPRLELNYEQLIADGDVQMHRAWEFLGVDAYDGRRDLLQRQESRKIRDTVANFEELASFFADGPYGWCFRSS